MDIKEVEENMNFVLMMLQQAMKTSGVAIGFDLKAKKLVLKDIKTQLISRIDLEELNKCLISD